MQILVIKLILIAAVLLIIALGAMVFMQQRAIRDIQMQLGVNSVTGNQSSVANINLNTSSKEIVGKITTIGSNQMIVVATVPDVEKIATFQNQPRQTVPVIHKTYTISLNAATTFTSIAGPPNAQFLAKDFQVGDEVRIETNETIFATDRVTALSVTYTGGRKVPLGSGIATTQQNATAIPSVKGTVVAIKDTTIAIQIGSTQRDSSAQMIIQKVSLTTTTKFLERTLKSPSEISTILDQYYKTANANTPFPMLYTSERTITKGDLKIGDRVGIYETQEKNQSIANTVVRLLQP